jgi:hypothetical protein
MLWVVLGIIALAVLLILLKIMFVKLRSDKIGKKVVEGKKIFRKEVKTEKTVKKESKIENILKKEIKLDENLLKIVGIVIICISILTLIGLGAYYLIKTGALNNIDFSWIKDKSRLVYSSGKDSLVALKDSSVSLYDKARSIDLNISESAKELLSPSNYVDYLYILFAIIIISVVSLIKIKQDVSKDIKNQLSEFNHVLMQIDKSIEKNDVKNFKNHYKRLTTLYNWLIKSHRLTLSSKEQLYRKINKVNNYIRDSLSKKEVKR